MEKASEHAKRLFAGKEKVFLIPVPAGGHWTLLVLDLRKDVPFDRQVRYYETLEIPSDLSKESAELLLASLLSLGIIDEKFLDRPSLERNNGVVRQKKGSNQCGIFVLAYMEQEVAEAMGYGPAAIGWPWVAAQNRVGKMRKLGEQLQVERNKRIQDLKKLDEKDKKNGEKMRLEREKVAELAGKMMAEHKKLNKMQEDAWKLVNEGGALRVDELPSAYLKAKAKIELDGIGVCGKCRYSSGCMECNVWKCTAYWMRKEGKRLGRTTPYEYTMAAQIAAGKDEKKKDEKDDKKDG